jgi:anaerobic magnesium-protoporphyrin IX monomethyl ester cyclase
LAEVLALAPHHLQVEPVKLLPGAPLRGQAAELGLYFDPAPPYSILRTAELDFTQLEQIRGVGRLLDLIGNSGRFRHFLEAETEVFGGLVDFYRNLQAWWQKSGLFEEPQGQRQLFAALYAFCQAHGAGPRAVEALARDFARAGRVVPGTAPVFFNSCLTGEEEGRVKQRVKQELDSLAAGEKLQHFAAVFTTLQPDNARSLLLYLYRSGNGLAPSCIEVFL